MASVYLSLTIFVILIVFCNKLSRGLLYYALFYDLSFDSKTKCQFVSSVLLDSIALNCSLDNGFFKLV